MRRRKIESRRSPAVRPYTSTKRRRRFLVLSGAMLLLSGIGLASGKVGSVARIGATAGSVGLLLAGIQVGGSGGDLVYRHNAASVYAAEEVVGAGVASRPSPAGTDVNGSR